MSLKVIGAGMGRTGTDSLRRALETLGFAPCHHMFALRDDPGLVPPWHAVAKGEARPDWDALFDGFSAQVDWPGAAFWRETTAHFPDANVILSVRDAESWYASLSETILPFIALKGQHNPPHRNDIADLTERLFDRIFDGRIREPDHAKAVYERHIEDVQREIPAHRLLVLPVGAGWQPLCTFLECAIPDEPYPSGNSSADFKARVAANLRSDGSG